MAQQIPPLNEVIQHYRTTGVLCTVDGRQSIDAVTAGLLIATDRELGAA